MILRMMDPKIIQEQVARFSNHPGLKSDEPAMASQFMELTSAFREACGSDAMVIMVANQVMKTVKFFPLPAHVWEAAAVVKDHEETDSARALKVIKQQDDEQHNIAANEKAYYEMAMALKARSNRG